MTSAPLHPRHVEARRDAIDRDDATSAEQERARDDELADRTTTEHRDRVAGDDPSEARAEVCSGQDIREEDGVVVGDLVRQLHRSDVCERHVYELGLHAVEAAAVLRPSVIGRAGLRPSSQLPGASHQPPPRER
jgi:hypothetical protein